MYIYPHIYVYIYMYIAAAWARLPSGWRLALHGKMRKKIE